MALSPWPGKQRGKRKYLQLIEKKNVFPNRSWSAKFLQAYNLNVLLFLLVNIMIMLIYVYYI